MGQCILFGFLFIGLVWLCFVFYMVGYDKGMEDLSRDYEEIDREFENEENGKDHSCRCDHIDSDSEYRDGGDSTPIKWDIEPPEFLQPFIPR